MAIHVIFPGTRLRGNLIGRFGEGVYRVMFAVLSLAVMVSLIGVYQATPPVPVDWWPWSTDRLAVAWVVMALALLFIAGALTGLRRHGPGNVPGAAGIYKITRAPLFVGGALWAVAHAVGSVDARAITVFAVLALLCAQGARQVDRRFAASHGAAGRQFIEQTSLFPLAAIIAGRARIGRADMGWQTPLLAILLGLGLAIPHAALTGVALY